MKSNLICNYFGVSSPAELVGYHYNHGNNPKFGIYRKCDIVLLDCSINEWQKWGRHPWEILPDAKKNRKCGRFAGLGLGRCWYYLSRGYGVRCAA